MYYKILEFLCFKIINIWFIENFWQIWYGTPHFHSLSAYIQYTNKNNKNSYSKNINQWLRAFTGPLSYIVAPYKRNQTHMPHHKVCNNMESISETDPLCFDLYACSSSVLERLPDSDIRTSHTHRRMWGNWKPFFHP